MAEQGVDMKYDGGKILAGIPFQDFNLALKAVAEVGTFGAKKYERSSWKTVPNALLRYTDAKFRHILEGEEAERDAESGLLHAAHEAWNALAILQLKLEAMQPKPYLREWVNGVEQINASNLTHPTQASQAAYDSKWPEHNANTDKNWSPM